MNCMYGFIDKGFIVIRKFCLYNINVLIIFKLWVIMMKVIKIFLYKIFLIMNLYLKIYVIYLVYKFKNLMFL